MPQTKSFVFSAVTPTVASTLFPPRRHTRVKVTRSLSCKVCMTPAVPANVSATLPFHATAKACHFLQFPGSLRVTRRADAEDCDDNGCSSHLVTSSIFDLPGVQNVLLGHFISLVRCTVKPITFFYPPYLHRTATHRRP